MSNQDVLGELLYAEDIVNASIEKFKNGNLSGNQKTVEKVFWGLLVARENIEQCIHWLGERDEIAP